MRRFPVTRWVAEARPGGQRGVLHDETMQVKGRMGMTAEPQSQHLKHSGRRLKAY